MKHRLILLVLLVILGTFLRFYQLGHESLWNDEFATWLRSGHANPRLVIERGARPDYNPPGYYLIMFYVQKHFGNSEFALRFPSAVSGVFTIIVAYLLGVRFYSHREGLIAAALTASLWCPIYYSQEARAYSLLLLFVMLATYFWLATVRKLKTGAKLSSFDIVAYLFSAVISAYLHYFGFYLVALQALYAALIFLKKPRVLLKVIVVYLVIFCAYLPWIPPLIKQMTCGGGTGLSWIPEREWYWFIYYLGFIFNKSYLVFSVALAFCACAILQKIYRALKHQQFESKFDPVSSEAILIWWLFAPFAIVFLVSTIMPLHILTGRNLIISLPAAYLLVSRALTKVFTEPRRLFAAATILLVIGLFDLVFIQKYYSLPQKEQYREAVNYIIGHDELYPDSIVVGHAWNIEHFNYYFRRNASDKRVDVRGGMGTDIPRVKGLIDQRNPAHIWFIQAHREWGSVFLNFLDTSFTSIEKVNFVGASVMLYKNERPLNSHVNTQAKLQMLVPFISCGNSPLLHGMFTENTNLRKKQT